MSDMYVSPKPQHLCTGNSYNSAKELLEALASLHIEGMAAAIVLTDRNGQFHTYQFGCNEYELGCCAEALDHWAKNYDAETIIAKSN